MYKIRIEVLVSSRKDKTQENAFSPIVKKLKIKDIIQSEYQFYSKTGFLHYGLG